MKKVFSKKILIPIMALFLCSVVAFGTSVVASQRSANIYINVNPDDTVKKYKDSNEDVIYVGPGINGWGMELGPESVEENKMSDAYFEVTAQRIIKTKPKMVRFMVQPYYLCFMDDEDAGEARWNAGELNFNSAYMYNVWRYLEIYQAAGTQVFLNWGYSHIAPMEDWFAIKDVPTPPENIAEYGRSMRTAPRNLKAFGDNLAIFLEECERRGFIGDTREESTIQYINFYNEVQIWEYMAFGDKRIYWSKMVEYCHKALVAKGFRDGSKEAINDRTKHRVLICGIDSALGSPIFEKNTELIEFIDYLYENTYEKGYCDLFDTHLYLLSEDKSSTFLHKGTDQEASISLANERWKAKYKGSLTFCMAEMGTGDSNKGVVTLHNGELTPGVLSPFNGTVISQEMGAALGGSIATLNWFGFSTFFPQNAGFNNTELTSPWMIPSKTEYNKGGIENVNASFGETGIFTRYLPTNSKVARSTVNEAYKEKTIVTSYIGEEDVAIVAEFDYRSDVTGFDYAAFKNGSTAENRTVQINLGSEKLKNKTYYKYVYEYPEGSLMNDATDGCEMYDGNAILPDGKPVSVVDGKINDTISGNHCLVIYSTIEPAQQIALAGTVTKDKDGKFEYSDDYSREITLDLANEAQKNNGVEIKVDLSACKNINSDDTFEFDVFRGVVDPFSTEEAPGYLSETLKKTYFKTDCSEYKNSSANGTTLNKRLGTVEINSDGISATYKCATDENGEVIAKAGDTIAVRVKIKGDTSLLNSVNNGTNKLQVYDTDVYAIAIIKIVDSSLQSK